MNALIVDDSRAVRNIVGRILKKIGFEVTQACNGKEALDQLKAMATCQLVLVDWHMPEMTGYEFLVAVRADSRFDGLPIIMITSESQVTEVQKSLDAGANEYLMKPFQEQALLEKLEIVGLPTSSV